MKRKAGYYWVKVKNDGTTGVEGNIRAGWRIAKYLSFEKQEEWEIVGSTVSESVLCEINETRIPSPGESQFMSDNEVLSNLLRWIDENKEYNSEVDCGYDHISGFEYINPDELKEKIQSLINSKPLLYLDWCQQCKKFPEGTIVVTTPELELEYEDYKRNMGLANIISKLQEIIPHPTDYKQHKALTDSILHLKMLLPNGFIIPGI